LKTYTVSIGTLSIKVRSDRAHDKGPDEEITVQIDWRTLQESWTTAKVYTLAQLRDLLSRYDAHLKQKERENMAQWPPHSLLCEKRCCQKSLTSYMRFLKKELVWGSDGHLQ
jgi:hypothetical protein